MQTIPLLAVPNQQLSVTIDRHRWDIRIKMAVTSLIIDLSLDNEIVIQGLRIIPNQPLIPYRYLSTVGNFMMLTNDSQLPDWTRLGIDHQLVYATADEISSYG